MRTRHTCESLEVSYFLIAFSAVLLAPARQLSMLQHLLLLVLATADYTCHVQKKAVPKMSSAWSQPGIFSSQCSSPKRVSPSSRVSLTAVPKLVPKPLCVGAVGFMLMGDWNQNGGYSFECLYGLDAHGGCRRMNPSLGTCEECAAGFVKQRMPVLNKTHCFLCDNLQWHDDEGRTCYDYAQSFCHGWIDKEYDVPFNGLKPSQACCACGGGSVYTTPTSMPLSERSLYSGEVISDFPRPVAEAVQVENCPLAEAGLYLESDGQISGVASSSLSCTMYLAQDPIRGLFATVELSVPVSNFSYGKQVLLFQTWGFQKIPTFEQSFMVQSRQAFDRGSFVKMCNPACPWLEIDADGNLTAESQLDTSLDTGLLGVGRACQCEVRASHGGRTASTSFVARQVRMWQAGFYNLPNQTLQSRVGVEITTAIRQRQSFPFCSPRVGFGFSCVIPLLVSPPSPPSFTSHIHLSHSHLSHLALLVPVAGRRVCARGSSAASRGRCCCDLQSNCGVCAHWRWGCFFEYAIMQSTCAVPAHWGCRCIHGVQFACVEAGAALGIGSLSAKLGWHYYCPGGHLDSRTLTLPSSSPHLLTMCVHTTCAFVTDDSQSSPTSYNSNLTCAVIRSCYSCSVRICANESEVLLREYLPGLEWVTKPGFKAPVVQDISTGEQFEVMAALRPYILDMRCEDAGAPFADYTWSRVTGDVRRKGQGPVFNLNPEVGSLSGTPALDLSSEGRGSLQINCSVAIGGEHYDKELPVVNFTIHLLADTCFVPGNVSDLTTWSTFNGKSPSECLALCRQRRDCAAVASHCQLLVSDGNSSANTSQTLVRLENCSEEESSLHLAAEGASYVQGIFYPTNVYKTEVSYARGGPTVERQLLLTPSQSAFPTFECPNSSWMLLHTNASDFEGINGAPEFFGAPLACIEEEVVQDAFQKGLSRFNLSLTKAELANPALKFSAPSSEHLATLSLHVPSCPVPHSSGPSYSESFSIF